MLPYLDTSALAKWYLNEPRSEEVEAYLVGLDSAAISSLTTVELRCLLARRRRAGEVDAETEMRVLAVFDEDIRRGFLRRYPLTDDHAVAALNLASSLSDHPLRTLDALHLAIAGDIGTDTLVTADRIMAAAAEAQGFRVVRFDA